LAHAAPSLGRGEPRFAGHDTTVRGNQHVLNIAPRNVGVADLQPVDRIVDLIGEIDSIFGGEQAATACVANKIRNPPWTNFRTFQLSAAEPCAAAQQRSEKSATTNAMRLRWRLQGAALGERGFASFGRRKRPSIP